MKKNLLFLLAFAIVAVVSSCSKDEEKEKFSKEPYANTTDEQNKAAIEQAGTDAIAKVEDMRNTTEMKAVGNMMKLISENPMTPSVKSSLVLEPFAAMNQFESGAISSKGLMGRLNSLKTTPEFEDNWAKIEGTWDWTGYGWTRADNEGFVVINFPKDSVDQANSATVMVAKPTFYEGDLGGVNLTDSLIPTSFSASLSIDGEELISFDYTGAFSDAPSIDVEASLTVAGFTLRGLVEANTSRINILQEFKYLSEMIYSVGYEMTGNFTDESIARLDADEVKISDIGGVLSFVKSHVQIFNIKLAADFDVATGTSAAQSIIDRIEADREITEEEEKAYMNEIIAAVNENVFIRILYANTNTMIAYAEAYFDNEIDEPNVRFVFGDGTKMDADLYMEENFSDLVEDLFALLDEISAVFGFNEVDEVEVIHEY